MRLNPRAADAPETGYCSRFSHRTETLFLERWFVGDELSRMPVRFGTECSEYSECSDCPDQFGTSHYELLAESS